MFCVLWGEVAIVWCQCASYAFNFHMNFVLYGLARQSLGRGVSRMKSTASLLSKCPGRLIGMLRKVIFATSFALGAAASGCFANQVNFRADGAAEIQPRSGACRAPFEPGVIAFEIAGEPELYGEFYGVLPVVRVRRGTEVEVIASSRSEREALAALPEEPMLSVSGSVDVCAFETHLQVVDGWVSASGRVGQFALSFEENFQSLPSEPEAGIEVEFTSKAYQAGAEQRLASWYRTVPTSAPPGSSVVGSLGLYLTTPELKISHGELRDRARLRLNLWIDVTRPDQP